MSDLRFRLCSASFFDRSAESADTRFLLLSAVFAASFSWAIFSSRFATCFVRFDINVFSDAMVVSCCVICVEVSFAARNLIV